MGTEQEAGNSCCVSGARQLRYCVGVAMNEEEGDVGSAVTEKMTACAVAAGDGVTENGASDARGERWLSGVDGCSLWLMTFPSQRWALADITRCWEQTQCYQEY